MLSVSVTISHDLALAPDLFSVCKCLNQTIQWFLKFYWCDKNIHAAAVAALVLSIAANITLGYFGNGLCVFTQILSFA